MNQNRKFNKIKQLILYVSSLFLMAAPLYAEAKIEISVLRLDERVAPPLSRLDLLPDDLAFAGANQGLRDNQTTGTFLGLEFIGHTSSGDFETLQNTMKNAYQQGIRIFIMNMPREALLRLVEPYPDALFFNAQSEANDLRNEHCAANLFHIAPSSAQKTDALIQYLMWKRWPKLFLIYGSHPEDQELAASYRESARKFGAKIVEEREFTDTQGARRTDTGHVQVQRQIPTFTQSVKAHDIVIAADANDVFAAYLPYRTWDARPVSGSAGLRPVTWDASMEAWGATQIQRRFEADTERYMREIDYQNWLAMRVIGEAVVRTNSADPKNLRAYLLSDAFEIAAFKGVKLNFRNWNGQLRQPILLSDRNLMVSVSPQEGYLHQYSELDSLGTDRAESKCTKFEDLQK